MRSAVSGRMSAAVTGFIAAAVAIALFNGPFAKALLPANKIAASGSTVEVMDPGETVTLLSGVMRTSSPEDIIFSVTAECAIVTNIMTIGNDTSSAFGQVRLWVELDGAAVPVSSDDATDPGRVVFCNRAFSSTTSGFDDPDATIQTFLKTRESNAFNWLTLNVGPGVHSIEVKGELTRSATPNAEAHAAVGKRTMIAEPTKLANNASI